jgi:dienelactone hydrolase
LYKEHHLMADTVLPKPDPQALVEFHRAAGLALHAKDMPPPDRKTWEERRARLRDAMFAAMGPFPDKPCALEPKKVGVLKRTGYRIEKLLLQTRPDVWMTASAYVPDPVKGKLPAVLAVHGHWPWARRDPVVQARCLGLVKLGFFVLAVDAFGAGERYTEPGKGTYHGALYGGTLWPTGQTLLGMQVYDNRRAVDYLRSRTEVDGDRLGITGASGGGNQTMYAGALDERFRAAVPVCSVGTYQAYLHSACCVCEVLPGGLRLAEEGDVLALVAPRALMVINATKDAFQFSVGEAEKSIRRARAIFKLYDVDKKLQHATFESGHAYNQPMREAMYGWMTRWLKDEGDGKPIAEPKHEVEKPEELACLSDATRPKTFLFPPSFAAREAARVLAKINEQKPDHLEDWESTAIFMRTRLRKDVFGGFPKETKPDAKLGEAKTVDGVKTTPVLLHAEPKLPLPVLVKSKDGKERMSACVLLNLDGKTKALEHPLAQALLDKGWTVVAPDLRGTGETKPAGDPIKGAPDHNSAEHALWIGRPLLGQWVFDVQHLLDWLALQPSLRKDRFAVAGIGQAGVVAICAAALLGDRIASAAALGAPATFVTNQPYTDGTRMGLLAPGILRVGDIPHLAAAAAPLRLIVAGGISLQGKKLTDKQLKDAYSFTGGIYKLHKAEAKLTLAAVMSAKDIAAGL